MFDRSARAKWLGSGFGLAVLLIHHAALAAVSASSEAVPWGYATVAEAQGVPATVLYAIALTESGHPIRSGEFRPWPWTLNVRGRAERYATRLDAHAALLRYLQQGITRVDVGPMQVNWHHHHQRLGTPWEALEPYHNLRTGSSILREEYQRTGDWRIAIGRYHSPGQTPAQRRRAAHYRRLVGQRLARIAVWTR